MTCKFSAYASEYNACMDGFLEVVCTPRGYMDTWTQRYMEIFSYSNISVCVNTRIGRLLVPILLSVYVATRCRKQEWRMLLVPT